eukprot:6184527-Pleurochrysis_carterae.AAC.1
MALPTACFPPTLRGATESSDLQPLAVGVAGGTAGCAFAGVLKGVDSDCLRAPFASIALTADPAVTAAFRPASTLQTGRLVTAVEALGAAADVVTFTAAAVARTAGRPCC